MHVRCIFGDDDGEKDRIFPTIVLRKTYVIASEPSEHLVFWRKYENRFKIIPKYHFTCSCEIMFLV